MCDHEKRAHKFLIPFYPFCLFGQFFFISDYLQELQKFK